MKTLNRIAELETQVINAMTYDVDGRQIVVKACKELHNLIEEDYRSAGADVLLEDMYNDLTAGNFAEPFMCEQKKSKFELYKTIYINNVLPRLDKATRIYRADDYSDNIGELLGFFATKEDAKRVLEFTDSTNIGEGTFSQITEIEVKNSDLEGVAISDNEIMLSNEIWGNSLFINESYYV